MSDHRSAIGTSEPRERAWRAVEGRGRYVDDIHLDRMLHVAFLRSPYPHARIVSVSTDSAREAAGVAGVFTGHDLADICQPFQTKINGVPDHKSAPQYPLAVNEACWQGETVAAVVAESRAEAEDAVELIEVEWEELPIVGSIDEAMNADGPTVHTSLGDNLAITFNRVEGDVDTVFADADHVVEAGFEFIRQTGVTLEPRGIIASFDSVARELVVHQSHQAPWQMRDVFATQLGLAPQNVRVIVPDVGGAFGTKLSAYGDELAVAAIAMKIGRPVKYICDRLESLIGDTHAREARAHCRMALNKDGRILGFDTEVLSGFGAYSTYPRSSTGEMIHAVQMVGAPYTFDVFRGHARGYLQNKAPTAPFRGVGQPIAVGITEELVDKGAAAIGMDPATFRRLNYRKTTPDTHTVTEAGLVIEELSLHECLDKMLELMDYNRLRSEQKDLREKGIYRGIGFGSFLELTGVGSGIYGRLGVPVSAEESCRLSLEVNGDIRCETSVTDQGQGTTSTLAQIVAAAFDMSSSRVAVVSGDTDRTPYGGGAWASRGVALGGEAARNAAETLKGNIFGIAAAVLQCEPHELGVAGGIIVGPSGQPTMTLGEVAAMVYHKRYEIPLGEIPDLTVSRSFSPETLPYLVSNGVQATSVEVDIETGIVKLLGFWIVDDCGRVINPLLVDEQLRGGAVQGIGGALFEECVYENGQMTNATLADYLLPMASELPDIVVGHISTPTRATGLGAKGVGEAGTVGAAAAVRTAITDALSPFGVRVETQPFTPARILTALMEAGH